MRREAHPQMATGAQSRTIDQLRGADPASAVSPCGLLQQFQSAVHMDRVDLDLEGRGGALDGGIAWELDSAKSSRLPPSHPAKLPSAGIRIAVTLADWKRNVWNDLGKPPSFLKIVMGSKQDRSRRASGMQHCFASVNRLSP